MRPRVTVVGAGVCGLSSACAVLDVLPQCILTVVSDTCTPHTTGDVAAGTWTPCGDGGTHPDRINKWASESWDRFIAWHKSGEAWGVSLFPGTILSDVPLQRDFWSHIPIDYAMMEPSQCREFGEQYVSGCTYTTLFAEASKFLPKLTEIIKKKGGQFKQCRLNSLAEAAADADVLVNCSGLGSRQLVPDPAVVPIRGQVVRVKAPWVTEYMCDESERVTYILPNSDCVVLGGTKQEGDWSTAVDDATTQVILARCHNLMPSLKDAEVLKVQVGLRPGRKGGVRLEKDVLQLPDRVVPVVHNYGHGGCGVTLMWGCANEVAELVKTAVNPGGSDAQTSYDAQLSVSPNRL